MAPAVLLRAAVALTGRFPALAGVDLVVAQGEVVVLEGPNGAGKTSVLRACAGLLPVTGGEAWVLGCDLRRDRAAVRRAVGLLGHSVGALRRSQRRRERAVRRPRHGSRCRRRRRRPRAPRVSSVGSAARRWGGCRPVSAGVWRSPCSSPAGPRCGSSTSHTPASTPPPGICSVRSWPRRWRRGRRSSWRRTSRNARFRSPTAWSCWPEGGSWATDRGPSSGATGGAPSHGAPTPRRRPHRP